MATAKGAASTESAEPRKALLVSTDATMGLPSPPVVTLEEARVRTVVA